MIVFSGSPARAEEDAYKKYNPDGMKFEFARSYIISVGYLQGVDKRWQKFEEIKEKNDEMKFIQWNIQRLVQDNMDMRIAKNYMTKYFNSKNPLMRKVTDSYVYVCDQIVALNREERDWWEQLKTWKDTDVFDADKDRKFVAAQEFFALKRKDAMRGLVEASVMMTKVLLSENTKEKQVKKRLAITTAERDKLIFKLDSFAKDNLDWGVQEGQTFLEAAQASIREVLEDPAYASADE